MNERTRFPRDEELGAALRELDVPEHAPGFHAELRRRLEAERRDRLAAIRRTRVRWGLRVAAVVVAAAVVLVGFGIPRTERTPSIAGPEVATAAQVRAKVRTALAAMRNLGGVLVYDGPEQGDEQRWRFTMTAQGDFRLDGPSDRETIAYDATAGVVRSAQRSASIGGATLFYAERRGVAPGPPDGGPPTWILPKELGSFVRALLAAEDARVRDTVHEGRPAWRVEVDVVPNAIVPELSGDRLEITVDRATGVPVRAVEHRRGDFLRELRIANLSVDGRLPADAFGLDFPTGAEVMRSDDGFRSVELREAEAVVGYAPLAPSWVPEGYELADVAVAAESGPTGTEAGNPPSRKVVSLSFRRGFDQFLVTTRLAHADGEWDDPLATGEGFVDEPERVTIGRGALEGEAAELVLVPRGIPHLWALTDELVVTVGGDLSRAELLRVTESLRR